MSSVSIQPNAGGTGVFTLTTPSSSTSYTLNLPAENGTLLTSASTVNLGSKIQPIDASTSSGSLLVTLYPTVLDFRSSTISSGTVNTRTIGTAITITVPNGATLGTIGANLSSIMVLAIDNGGTVELAVTNGFGSNRLDETNLLTTSQITSGSSSNTAVYSTTARTSVPYRVVGFIQSTQPTAGYWTISSATTTTIQGIGGQAMAAMNSLGYGQTWQSVTRTSATTYYNTTGKPIILTFYSTSTGGGGECSITVNSVYAARQNQTTAAGGTINAVIPPGAAYVLTYATYTSVFVSELR